jgi:hypothetical protein
MESNPHKQTLHVLPSSGKVEQLRREMAAAENQSMPAEMRSAVTPLMRRRWAHNSRPNFASSRAR